MLNKKVIFSTALFLIFLGLFQGCQGCWNSDNSSSDSANTEELASEGEVFEKREENTITRAQELRASKKAAQKISREKTGAPLGKVAYALQSGSVIDGPSGKKFIRIDVAMFNLALPEYTFSQKNFRLVAKDGTEFVQSKNGDSVGFFPNTLKGPVTVEQKQSKTVTLIYEIPKSQVKGAKLKVIYGTKNTLLDIPFY